MWLDAQDASHLKCRSERGTFLRRQEASLFTTSISAAGTRRAAATRSQPGEMTGRSQLGGWGLGAGYVHPSMHIWGSLSLHPFETVQ